MRRSWTLIALVLWAASAHAQNYPSKPTTIIVAAAPGGAADVIARAVAQQLAKVWGQPVIVENKAGANSQIGAAYVAKAAPDGYTLLATQDAAFVINPYLYAKLSYDPVKDLTPVTGLGAINQALVVHPSVPMQSIEDFVALAKAKPGELNYAGLGVGSTSHLSMELLQRIVGVKLNAIQYKGGGPALVDVIAGHITMVFINVGLMVQPWKAGQVRPLGVGSSERLAEFPDLPTIAETIPGFRAAAWFGLFAPSGTRSDIVAKINIDVQKVLADAVFRERFLAPNFYMPVTGSPEQFAKLIKADAARWSKVIMDAKLRAE